MITRSLLPAALLLLGCRLHNRPVAPEPARGPARDSLFQLDQSRRDTVAARGPVDGMLALLDPDVVFLRAGVPATYGREAARALFTAGSRPSSGAPVWQPLGGGVSYDLRSAYTFGIAAHGASSGTRLERYIAFWQRGRAQPWRIVAYAEVNGLPGVEVSLTADQLSPPARQVSRDAAEAAARIRAVDSLFSDLADRMGTAYAFSNAVARYGAVFGATQLVVGPEAVNEFYATQNGGTALTWRPVFGSVAASGDLGFTIGEYIATGRGPSGAAVQRFGKYLTVWQRQPDGSWKFVIDGGNPTPARAER
jgi:ketosteroid isomerase-like protein